MSEKSTYFVAKKIIIDSITFIKLTTMVWYIWVIITAALVIIELFTGGFGVLSFAFGCAAGALASVCGLSLNWQLLLAILVSLVFFFFIRPFAVKFLLRKKDDEVRTNTEALIGRKVRVTETVDAVAGTGHVAVDGDVWKAVAKDGNPIPAGTTVRIVAQDSLILTVEQTASVRTALQTNHITTNQKNITTMNPGTLVLIAIAIVVIFYVLSGIKIVSQSEVIIVERLGKYQRTLGAGIHVMLPIIERARVVRQRGMGMSARIDLREQVFDFDRQTVITKDNVMTEINALLYFQIVDPVKSVYEITNLPLAIEKLTQTTLRNVVGELELDETLTSRDTINSKLRTVLDDATNKWGVKVNRVELQDIMPPVNIQEAMEKQMTAERDKRAAILTAEGEKQSAILKSEGEKSAEINAAEAEKQARILRAEGAARAQVLQAEAEANAINKVAEAVKGQKSNPVNYLLAIKYIESLKEMTSGKDNKTVYLPYEATGVLGSLGTIKDMFKHE